MANIDKETVAAFGDEWSTFQQDALADKELRELFEKYFHIFPWDKLPAGARGFDMGCGSGRWAKCAAPRVGHLTCIDPSPDALAVAKRNVGAAANVTFLNEGVSNCTVPAGSQDFGYSLGVLHHIPDTLAAMQSCTRLLKPGAPFLVYLYYRFDNKPAWFRMIWRASEVLRAGIARTREPMKTRITDVIAATVYYPMAGTAWLLEKMGMKVENLPLSAYRNTSFYTMRTDSRDRFGTPLEQRFTRKEMADMMTACGLENITFSEKVPYWVAVGFKT